jgi:hypothetical protein
MPVRTADKATEIMSIVQQEDTLWPVAKAACHTASTEMPIAHQFCTLHNELL